MFTTRIYVLSFLNCIQIYARLVLQSLRTFHPGFSKSHVFILPFYSLCTMQGILIFILPDLWLICIILFFWQYPQNMIAQKSTNNRTLRENSLDLVNKLSVQRAIIARRLAIDQCPALLLPNLLKPSSLILLRASQGFFRQR